MSTKIRYERVLVTPAKAVKWLGLNSPVNRSKKASKIGGYAADMQAGRWNSDTGETIKFDTSGTLIDGQNRLEAVVLANVPVEFDVAYDVPSEAMIVIDSGAARTFGDVLAISGSPDRFRVASVVRWMIGWDAGNFRGQGGRVAPSNAEQLQRYHSDPSGFDTAAMRGKDVLNQGLGTSSASGTAYYLFARINPDLTKSMFDQVISGANLPHAHPALTLRNRLGRVRYDRASRQEQLAMFIRAWNALRKNEELTRIQVTRSGDLTNANFPRPL